MAEGSAGLTPRGEAPDPGTFVLVAGGWHGGWCWAKVARLLRAAGHEVYTPTLTGLGERAHLLHRDIGLGLHVLDVVRVLEYEDLGDVTLVGHSYGGMVISGVADHVPDRLARLVYLDAFVPEDGRSVLDLLLPERREVYLRGARERGEGWRVPPPSARALGVTGEKEARRVDAKLTPQPLRTFEEPVRLTNPKVATLPRTYIYCATGPVAPSFAPFATRFRDAPGWSYHELATGHDAMLTVPEELAGVLLNP